MEVVELKERNERGVQLMSAAELASAKDNPPVLVQDGSLQAFDESVDPRMSWLGSGVTNVEFLAGFVEVGLELAFSIRQHTAHFPPGFRDHTEYSCQPIT